jgi:uncharacterized protein DUF6623
MTTHRTFVHGNSFAPPERPGPGPNLPVFGIGWTDALGLHRGWGVTWRAAWVTNIFHVAIPVPSMIVGSQARLDKVFVLFNIQGWAEITHVHVWDGPRFLQEFTNFSRSGDHSGAIDNENTFDLPSNPAIQFGVGLSVIVRFNSDANITFTGAGADFLI